MRLEDLPPRYRAQAERQISRPSLRHSPVPPSPRPSPSPQDTPERPSTAFAARTVHSPVQTQRKGAGKRKSRYDNLPPAVVKKFYRGKLSLGFEILLDPTTLPTAQQKGARPFIGKDGKPHTQFYTQAHITRSYKRLGVALKPFVKFTSDWPEKAPLAVKCLFKFPFTKSTPKRDLPPPRFCAPHTETPDVDNIWKKTADTLTEIGLWHDDSQINDLCLGKRRFNGEPSVCLLLTRITPTTPKTTTTPTARKELKAIQDKLFKE